MRITWDNLDTLEYIPSPGIEYEVAQGCIRSLRRPLYEVMRLFLDRLAGVDLSAKPGDENHEDSVRLSCLVICTEGDPMPEGWTGVDIAIATRAVSDFFTLRIPRPARPPKS
jgi:hypothetical protein